MKKLISLANAQPLNKLAQKNVKGGILPCPWYFECDSTGLIYGTLSACRANCAGGFCFRDNPCL
jgi:hypothetical protein